MTVLNINQMVELEKIVNGRIPWDNTEYVETIAEPCNA